MPSCTSCIPLSLLVRIRCVRRSALRENAISMHLFDWWLWERFKPSSRHTLTPCIHTYTHTSYSYMDHTRDDAGRIRAAQVFTWCSDACSSSYWICCNYLRVYIYNISCRQIEGERRSHACCGSYLLRKGRENERRRWKLMSSRITTRGEKMIIIQLPSSLHFFWLHFFPPTVRWWRICWYSCFSRDIQVLCSIQIRSMKVKKRTSPIVAFASHSNQTRGASIGVNQCDQHDSWLPWFEWREEGIFR